MRWSSQVERAARVDGWRVVETDGIDDYQGWGVHLLSRERELPTSEAEEIASDAAMASRFKEAHSIRESNLEKRTEWAVAAWSYGSCGGCDAYEQEWYDNTLKYDDDGHYVSISEEALDTLAWKLFGDLIEVCPTEEAARMKFSERKGW